MLRRLAWLGVGAVVVGGGLAALLRPPYVEVPKQGAVLTRVTIVNPGGERLPDRTLTVRGGTIASIEQTQEGAPPGPYDGAFVLPGLVDLHVHHPPAWALGERALFGLLFLAHGVTTVRDTGASGGSLEPDAERIREGRRAGPRLFHCGEVLDGDPPLWPTARVVAEPADAKPALRQLAADGARCAKVYNRLSPEALAAIQEGAEDRGLPIVAHVPDAVSLSTLEGAEVQHFTGLTSNWWRVSGERLDWYAETSRARGISHTPTLVAFEQHTRLADYPELVSDPGARWLPPYYREIVWNPAHNRLALLVSPAGGSTVKNRVPVMQELVARLHRLGVPVLVGTDTGNPFVVPGASLHQELRLLADAGLSPEEVWEAATRQAGEVLDVPGLGVLAPGHPADLLVFRADPTRDLSALDTLEAVIAAGRLYRRSDLEAELERQRAHYANPLVDAISRLGARATLYWLRRHREQPPPRSPGR
jgi:imidazolonepropionase-like amidohydrolase